MEQIGYNRVINIVEAVCKDYDLTYYVENISANYDKVIICHFFDEIATVDALNFAKHLMYKDITLHYSCDDNGENLIIHLYY